MDEGICVDQLDRAGRGHRLARRAPACLRSSDAEQGTQAFSPGKKTVTHGPMDGCRPDPGGGNACTQGLFHPEPGWFDPTFELWGSHGFLPSRLAVRTGAILAKGRQLMTSDFVSHPLRAAPIPK